MLKEKWILIVAGVLSVIWIVKGYFASNEQNELIDGFRDKLRFEVQRKRKEAIDRAEEKHSDSVDSNIDDWLDDQLGSDREPS